jgi:hypothetical protein
MALFSEDEMAKHIQRELELSLWIYNEAMECHAYNTEWARRNNQPISDEALKIAEEAREMYMLLIGADPPRKAVFADFPDADAETIGASNRLT